MCGRYYFDNDTMEDLERLTGGSIDRSAFSSGDVYPSAEGFVLTGRDGLHAEKMQWGFPGFQKNRLLINARAETAMEKKTFADSVLHRSCIIPAKWFYDFRDSKERYVILTTQANDSMTRVHDRMPLILPEEKIREWIVDDSMVGEFLRAQSPELRHRQDYEQLSFEL